jgi:hypothetical protein
VQDRNSVSEQSTLPDRTSQTLEQLGGSKAAHFDVIHGTAILSSNGFAFVLQASRD